MALKQIDPSAATDDPLARLRFEREQRIVAMLDHPGIVRCLGTGVDWLALEPLDPGLSDPAVQRRYRDRSSRLVLLGELAQALAYLHARGIVHADIKPSNVMFRDGRPVLIDFGIAALGPADPVASGEMAGSPAWMAPEQLGGTTHPAGDVWAMCRIVQWLGEGSPPVRGGADEVLALRRAAIDAGGDWRWDAAAPIHRDDEPDDGLAALLRAGLGPAQGRPMAAAIVRQVQEMSSSTAG